MSYTPINSYATRVGQYLAQITQNIRCNPHWGGGGIENEKRKLTYIDLQKTSSIILSHFFQFI